MKNQIKLLEKKIADVRLVLGNIIAGQSLGDIREEAIQIKGEFSKNLKRLEQLTENLPPMNTEKSKSDSGS